MCCLKNEQAAYEDIIKTIPPVGSIVETADGKGAITAVSVLKGILTVAVENGDEKRLKDYKAEDVKVIKKAFVKNDEKVDMAELRKLEKD